MDNSISISKHHHRSLRTALLQCFIRPFGTLISKPGKPLPPGSPQLKPPAPVARQCNVSERRVDDVWIYDLTTKSLEAGRNKRSQTHRVYYVAGGSFCMPPSPNHWKFLAELSKKMPDSIVSLISPPLAPHSPGPLTFPHLVKLFSKLLSSEENEIVSFVGDSSGGNIVLAVMLEALRGHPEIKSPANLMLIAPVVDLGFTNSRIQVVERYDPILRLPIEIRTAKSWADSWDLSDSRLSPLFTDLSILRGRRVKIHGVTGGYDILTPDTLLFRQRCEAARICGEWLEWEKQMHCFPIAFAYGLPESVKGKDWIINVLKRNS